MKNEKEFIQDFKNLLAKYNYYIWYDWDEGYRICSNNKEDEYIVDYLTLGSIDE